MIKVISHVTRRMQRVGFLKQVVASASPQRPTSPLTIGKTLLHSMCHKYTVAIGRELQEYCDRVFSEQHYSELRLKMRKALAQQPPGQLNLELQDIYLSQDVLPSKRGRILQEKDQDVHVFPGLAVSMGLLTPETYVLTSRGRLFLQTIASGEISAFNQLSDVNPLSLSPRQITVLLFSFLQADGDLLSLLYPVLATIGNEFYDYNVGDIIGDQLSAFLERIDRSGGAMRDRDALSKLRKTTARIKQWKGKPYSGKGARDEWATLRLEPFVDLGLFAKPDKFSYKYRFTTGGRRFVSDLQASQDLEAFLGGQFVSAVAHLANIDSYPASDSREVLEYLREAHHVLANNIGYSEVVDTALLAGTELLFGKGRLLEVDNAIAILREAQKDRPHEIHFNVDRWGNLKFVSFRKT